MPALYKTWLYRARLAIIGKMLLKPQPKPMAFSGPGSSANLCKAIGQFGLKNLLIVTDKPLRELGLLDKTLADLAEQGVNCQIYDGVLPDPTMQVVDDGIAMLNANNCDAVLAFGGGSSIDTAKVVALAGANGGTAESCLGVNKCSEAALPLFAIPTTAGTGSEGTCIAVVSDNETHSKSAVIDNSLIPKAAALDPEVMLGLPASMTAATGMDALTHAIESYIGTIGNDETDFYGLAAAKLIFRYLPTACSDGQNMEAREGMSLASYYGGLAITQALVGYAHAISHNLGARYGVAHGLGNAVALPHVLDQLKDDAQEKMAELALHCELGNADEGSTVLAQKLVDSVRDLNRTIGIPDTIDVIKHEDFDELVDLALTEGSSYPTPRFFEPDECRTILQRMSVSTA
ncbi:MAG: iron-containing alcohol dehydrogenase [Halieaceae bacterium]